MDHCGETWKETAQTVAYTVGLGAKKLTETAKKQLAITDLRAEINACFRELGELLYATHTGTPTDSDLLLAKMREIDELRANLTALEGEPVIHLLCPVCGHEVREEDLFCRDCGAKL